jgi:hypothetical protein
VPPGNAASCSSTAERFSLAGPSLALDPRTHAYRRDIADIDLAGLLFAPHYARAVMRAAQSPAELRTAPGEDGQILTQLTAGDRFALLDVSGGWAWGYALDGHIVGYVEADRLA